MIELHCKRQAWRKATAYIVLALCSTLGCRAGKSRSPWASRFTEQSPAPIAVPTASAPFIQEEATTPDDGLNSHRQQSSYDARMASADQRLQTNPRPDSAPLVSTLPAPVADRLQADLSPPLAALPVVDRNALETPSPDMTAKSAAPNTLIATQPNSQNGAGFPSAANAVPFPVTTKLNASSSAAVAKPQPTIDLQIANVRPHRGVVKVAVFTSAANFPNKESAIQTLEFDGSSPNVATQLNLTQACVIAVYQDIDGNGELTTNRFGIPIEPCGFSNNAAIKRGPPSFSSAAVKPTSGGQPTLVRIDLP